MDENLECLSQKTENLGGGGGSNYDSPGGRSRANPHNYLVF